MTNVRSVRAVIAAVLLSASMAPAHASSEERSLEELRNTVVNLLQALVDQKVLTSEQASRMVQQAQDKAATDAAASAAKDAGAVRVTYVPQVVRDEIAKEVVKSLEPTVVQDVIKTGKSEGWAVPAGLPDWMARVQVFGDVRVRAQEDLFGHDNTAFTVPDYNAINAAGGISKAGINAFLDSTEDRRRLRLRARFGIQATLLDNFEAGLRLSTGSSLDPSSESQTLGTNGARYGVGLDLAYIRYIRRNKEGGYAPLTVTAGRTPSPWFNPTELVFARDLTFEGVSTTLRLPLGHPSLGSASTAYITLGGFPMQEVPLVAHDSKWLVAGQIGTDLRLMDTDRLRVGAAYYDFIHAAGRANPAGLSIYNYTAPSFLRFGNSVFDIQNSLDGSSNLFALAAQFRLVNLSAQYSHSFGDRTLDITADAVRNIGYSTQDVLLRSGLNQAARRDGYVGEVSFGHPDTSEGYGRWRLSAGYRYVQRDAVLDAWTDTDFHGGGTNAHGVFFVGEYGLAHGVWLRTRYFNGDVIDAPPRYSLDVIQIDLNAKF